jgi:hypothetical protein
MLIWIALSQSIVKVYKKLSLWAIFSKSAPAIFSNHIFLT